MREMDDETVACIVERRSHFEDLRQVAAQLAGLQITELALARGEPSRVR